MKTHKSKPLLKYSLCHTLGDGSGGHVFHLLPNLQEFPSTCNRDAPHKEEFAVHNDSVLISSQFYVFVEQTVDLSNQ